MIFRKFVEEQIGRLMAFATFAQNVPEDGRKEIRRWLEDRAACDPKAVSESTLSWLQNDEAARRVKSVIDECLTFETLPDLRTMRAVWDRLYPPDNVRRKNCERCDGSGWVTVEGPFGTSACYHCNHGLQTEAEARMGVRFSPTTAQHYSREAEEAGKRHEDWLRRRAAKPEKGFRRVTQADVDAIVADRGL